MDALTMAMMLQAISEGSQKLGQAGTAAASIDRLSPEQRNKIKELERQQALGLLGLDAGQQQRILSQQLQPVQTAEREAFNRQAQGQMIGDVGQGATFRGQQALLEGASRARTQATSAAQQQIAELDELAKARQLNEMAQLKQQQQQNRMATAQLVAGIVGGGTEIAAGIAGSEEAGKHQKAEREIALLTAQENADKARAALEKKILNKVSDTPTSIPDYVESLEGYTEPIIPRITPEDPVLEVESFGPKTLKWGVMTPVLDESNTIVGFTFVSNKGKEGIMPNANVTLEQSLAEYAKGVE